MVLPNIIKLLSMVELYLSKFFNLKYYITIEPKKDPLHFIEAANGENTCILGGEILGNRTFYSVSNNETW